MEERKRSKEEILVKVLDRIEGVLESMMYGGGSLYEREMMYDTLSDAMDDVEVLLKEEEKDSPLEESISVPVSDIGIFELVFNKPVRGLRQIREIANQVIAFVRERRGKVINKPQWEFKNFILDDGVSCNIRKKSEYKVGRVNYKGRNIAYLYYNMNDNIDMEEIREMVVENFMGGNFIYTIKDSGGNVVFVAYDLDAYHEMEEEGEL